MNILVIADANNQTAFSRERLAKLLSQYETWRLILVGTRPAFQEWAHDFPLFDDMRTTKSQLLTNAEHATHIHMAFEAAKLLCGGEQPERCIVLGLAPSMRELADLITRQGVPAIHAGRMTEAHLKPTQDRRADLIQNLRRIHLTLARQHKGPVSLSRFAELAVSEHPELQDTEQRMRLFGAKRFQSIARAAGLTCKGDKITGVLRSLDLHLETTQ